MMLDATSVRQRLLKAGFAPIPVEGKRPAAKAWEQKTSSNFEEIALWEQIYHLATNTGILTRLTPTIDIDILNQEAADAIEQLAREQFEERGNILVRFGKPPKRAIPLRTDRPFPKLSRNIKSPDGSEHKIELLCDGQQVVVFGIHPDTRQPYTWFGGEPGQIGYDDLPYCNHEHALKFIDDAAKLLCEQFGFVAAGDRPKETNGAGFGHADWSWLIANIHAGRELHDSSIVLASKLLASGMTDAAAVNFLRGVFEASTAPRDQRWQDRYDDIPRDVRSAREKFGAELGAAPQQQPAPPQKPITALVTVPAAVLEGIALPVRRWLAVGRVPMRNVTLLAGDGATGKTTIALQLAVVVAIGQNDWLGALIDEPGPVLFLTAEEERDEIHFRLSKIAPHYGASFANLDNLHLFSAAGQDSVLGAVNRAGMLVATDFYQQLRLSIEALRPKLVILESSADLYGGNENDRAHVRQFIRWLRALAIEFDCAIVLISHPSMSGLASGSGTSGTTGWNNAVRSRMYFSRLLDATDDKPEDADDIQNDVRLLKVMKANYAPAGETVSVVYRDGVFARPATKAEYEKMQRENICDRLFLTLLATLTRQGRNVSPNRSNSYAPSVLADLPDAKKIRPKVTASEFRDAMERAFSRDKIRVEQIGSKSRRADRLVLLETPTDGVRTPLLTVGSEGTRKEQQTFELFPEK